MIIILIITLSSSFIIIKITTRIQSIKKLKKLTKSCNFLKYHKLKYQMLSIKIKSIKSKEFIPSEIISTKNKLLGLPIVIKQKVRYSKKLISKHFRLKNIEMEFILDNQSIIKNKDMELFSILMGNCMRDSLKMI